MLLALVNPFSKYSLSNHLFFFNLLFYYCIFTTFLFTSLKYGFFILFLNKARKDLSHCICASSPTIEYRRYGTHW